MPFGLRRLVIVTATPQHLSERLRVRIRGLVQGVGFRPFVYRLATSLDLGGHVLNDSGGVVVEVEGPPHLIGQFLARIRSELPVLARIDDMETAQIPFLGDPSFVIQHSQASPDDFVLISPDVSPCGDCLRELEEPGDRRFQYPFINCTNCGPRYTIVREIPYDRPNTTMHSFKLCKACQAEYTDPSNRRFHAQPVACPECGPGIALRLSSDDSPAVVSGRSIDSIRAVQRLISDGSIVALRGLGGFHLACDASNEPSVRRLRERKHRPDKPFAVMARDIAAAEALCFLSEADRQALISPECPIVIAPRQPASPIAALIAPGNQTIGVMLPSTPLHHLLFDNAPYAVLVMTSGNMSEEPVVIDNDVARDRLSSIADAFLLHDRGIAMRADDSVLRTFEGEPRLIRRARGFAPKPIELRASVDEVLGCGAEMKNTFCLTRGRYAFVSPHLGDLQNYETFQAFEQTLEHYKRLFRFHPRALAHDLHPGYVSTQYALAQPDIPKIGIQHHHAHIASCMAENGLTEPVIGVAFDGTGYGTDGAIWGGEFFVGDLRGFDRRAHFRYVAQTGGDAAIRQPWRSAVSYLRDALGSSPRYDLAREHAVDSRSIALVETMIERGINTIDSSSCGRLFDAVASLIGVRQEITFEAQAAIELETLAAPDVEGAFSFDLDRSGDPIQIDFRATITGIVEVLRSGTAAPVIAARFHNTIARAITEVCKVLRIEHDIDRVCLSGGVFQNFLLLSLTARSLRSAGFKLFLHSHLPCNDGGVSVGQAVIAAEGMRVGAVS